MPATRTTFDDELELGRHAARVLLVAEELVERRLLREGRLHRLARGPAPEEVDQPLDQVACREGDKQDDRSDDARHRAEHEAENGARLARP